MYLLGYTDPIQRNSNKTPQPSDIISHQEVTPLEKQTVSLIHQYITLYQKTTHSDILYNDQDGHHQWHKYKKHNQDSENIHNNTINLTRQEHRIIIHHNFNHQHRQVYIGGTKIRTIHRANGNQKFQDNDTKGVTNKHQGIREYQPNYLNPNDPVNQGFKGPAYRGNVNFV